MLKLRSVLCAAACALSASAAASPVYVEAVLHDARHTVLTIELKDNSSAKAFADLLKANDVTLHLADYGGFEKVGDLPKTLPRNDVDIRTHPGDIILYLGKHICLYYATNEWRFTRLGRITNPDPQSLKQVFGPADIDVTFRLKR